MTHHLTRQRPQARATRAAPAALPRTMALVSPLLATLLLSACGLLPREPSGSNAPSAEAAVARIAASAPGAWQVPASYVSAPPGSAAIPTAAGEPSAAIGFGDAALVSLIQAATGASATLSAAQARIEAARAQQVAAGAALAPRLEANASLSRGRSVPKQPAADTASAGLQAGWELDLFGARTAQRESAERRLEAARLQWHAARVALASEVATTYVALRACEAQIEPAALDAESRAQTARLTEQSAQAGIAAPANAALARAGAAQARAQLVQQRAACDSLVKALVALTGTPESDLRSRLAVGSARQPAPTAAAPQVLPAALLSQRPDLLATARLVAAAAADERQAGAERLPQVALSGQVGLLRVASGGATQEGAVWSLGPLSVTLPLFDGGRRAAQQESARAAYDDAVVQLQAALRGAVREVEDALVALNSVAAREADTGVATEGFEASLRAAEARWRGGVGSLFELEEARRSALAARSALVELQRERATAWINLYRALGGGWSASDPVALRR